MKRFDRRAGLVLILILFVWAIGNLAILLAFSDKAQKAHLVEINRISASVGGERDLENVRMSDYEYVTVLEFMPIAASASEANAYFRGDGVDRDQAFQIRPVYDEGHITGYVRYVYEGSPEIATRAIYIIYNLTYVVAVLLLMAVMFYIRSRILKPFHAIRDLPIELSKGRLENGLHESKDRYFGQFIWGLNMLRDSIEAQNQKSLLLEKERKTLVLSISHGIKTPLSAIMLYAKGIKKGVYENSNQLNVVASNVEEHARQIELLVKDIVNTQTENLVDLDICMSEFYLEALLAGVDKAFREKLNTNQTQLDIGSHTNPLLSGDPIRLQDVLSNLMENALKYGDGERIEFRFSKEEGHLLWSLYNTGTPIPTSERAHVFESFWRGSNSVNRPGNGLGLYISKHIMTRIGGDIYVETDDRGTAFVMVIPLAFRYNIK